MPSIPGEAKRHKVGFRYDAINPDFLKLLAEIAAYADKEYGKWDNYTSSRLNGDQGPINHIYEHLRQYQTGEAYDHFNGDPKYHLAAVAYNAMMEFYYLQNYERQLNPLCPAKNAKSAQSME